MKEQLKELVQKIRVYVDDECECAFCEHLKQPLNDLEAPANKSPWIPVEERLPEVGTDVLFRAYERIYCGRFNAGEWWSDWHPRPMKGVTHWMPIPPLEGGAA